MTGHEQDRRVRRSAARVDRESRRRATGRDTMSDDLDLAAQPACTACGTVLHFEGGGYRCRGCDLTFLGNYDGRRNGGPDRES